MEVLSIYDYNFQVRSILYIERLYRQCGHRNPHYMVIVSVTLQVMEMRVVLQYILMPTLPLHLLVRYTQMKIIGREQEKKHFK